MIRILESGLKSEGNMRNMAFNFAYGIEKNWEAVQAAIDIL